MSDPKLILTENGADLNFIDGRVEYDSGLENLALISLFTRQEWFGNILLSNDIGSPFELATEQAITLQSLNDIRDAAEKSLVDPAFGSVTVTVTNPISHQVRVSILIEPPANTQRELILTRYGRNWRIQSRAHNGA